MFWVGAVAAGLGLGAYSHSEAEIRINLQFGKEIFNASDLSKQIQNSFREAQNIQTNLAGGAIVGAVAGLGLSKGALGLATLFGKASTGELPLALFRERRLPKPHLLG